MSTEEQHADLFVNPEAKREGGGCSLVVVPHGLDDPNLTPEELDYRLAIALQKQENAAALEKHKKKHEAVVHANELRTARSSICTKLAAVRAKERSLQHVPSEYYTTDYSYARIDSDDDLPPINDVSAYRDATPQEIDDFLFAQSLQKVEQVGAGTAQTLSKIMKEEEEDAIVQAHRTSRSNFHRHKRR